MSGPTGEYQLEFEGFVCPESLVNDFTPSQFEEMVSMFKRTDADGSGNIDLEEINKMLADMDMDHLQDAALELLEDLDTDGSGELDFAEFCDFFSRLQKVGWCDRTNH